MKQTVTLTLEQVREIYKAGIERGSSEATAFEWGSSPGGKAEDELANAIHEIANAGKDFDHPQYVQYGGVDDMFFALAAR